MESMDSTWLEAYHAGEMEARRLGARYKTATRSCRGIGEEEVQGAKMAAKKVVRLEAR